MAKCCVEEPVVERLLEQRDILDEMTVYQNGDCLCNAKHFTSPLSMPYVLNDSLIDDETVELRCFEMCTSDNANCQTPSSNVLLNHQDVKLACCKSSFNICTKENSDQVVVKQSNIQLPDTDLGGNNELLTTVVLSPKSINNCDNELGDTTDDESSLGTEESWSVDSAAGSHCFSMEIIAEDKINSLITEEDFVRKECCYSHDSETDPLDDMSLSSQISDSLSSFSLQDNLSSASTTSAYFTESAISPNASFATFENLEHPSDIVSDPLRPSLFPNCPPTINFILPEQKGGGQLLPEEVKKVLKWQLTRTTPVILKKILISSGFRFTRKLNTWIGSWGKHMKAFEFQYLRDYQKVNHYPGTFQVGRKDRLWRNICRMQQLHSKKEFGFVPMTFVLPNDLRKLWLAWNTTGSKPRWIVKPPAAARGKGIHVVHKFGQLPKHGSFIVQRYLSQPYLINGSKFDLRIYVYVPSFNPLRIYLFNDGLVRFASVKYSNAVNTLRDQYVHLTNSSVNKSNASYRISGDENACCGHKWSLNTLWRYLQQRGIDTNAIWASIVDIVIKTIISCEPYVTVLTRGNVNNRYNCHEVFGFDIMLDAALKPWLLEVNISPSLHSSSSLDVSIKGKMLRELLNLAGFRLPSHVPQCVQKELSSSLKIDDHFLTLDVRLFKSELCKEEKLKQEQYFNLERSEYLDRILEKLTPDDIIHLTESEDELSRAHHFERVFPTSTSYSYHKFFAQPQYYVKLLDAWESQYHKNREKGHSLLRDLCNQKLHLSKLKDTSEQGDQSGLVKLRKSAVVCNVNRTCHNHTRLRWLMRKRSSILSALHKFHHRQKTTCDKQCY